MATFVITSNGKKFKVTAPDQQTALDAFASEAGLQPSEGNQRIETASPMRADMPAGVSEAGGDAPTGYSPSSVPWLDPINALGTSFADSVPVIGPALNDFGAGVDAAFASLVEGRPVTKEERLGISESERRQFPEASLAGTVAGVALPLGAVGATKLGGQLLGLTGKTIPRTAASLGSTFGITTADQMARGESFQDAAWDSVFPSVVAGLIPGAESVARALVRSGGKTVAPTVEALKDEAGQIYDAARASGVEVNRTGTINLADQMYDLARQEGIISPTGRMTGGYPKITEAVKTFDDFATGGAMSVPQMQAVRRTLQDAAGSLDAGERRIGKLMLDKFDEFVEKGVPELAEASQIYHRAKKGELIETAIELAGSRAGQFTGSGFENALRTEFRNLERQIIKGTLKGITEAEKEAISKVAKGGSLENVARWFGKFAPTGVVSTGLSAGVPFAVGNAVGGPVIGGAMAAGALGLGAGGRALATGLQKGNASVASALMRRGGPAVLSGTQRALLGGIGAVSVPAALAARGLTMGES